MVVGLGLGLGLVHSTPDREGDTNNVNSYRRFLLTFAHTWVRVIVIRQSLYCR